MRWTGNAARMGETRNVHNISVEKPEGKRSLVRSRRRSIRLDLREIGWEGVDWIHLAQDRDRWRALVNTVTKLWVL
jgi:hypothetical protein